MIEYKKYTLENGLRLLVHEDDSTPMAAVNILYDVGSKDESEAKTGFAHLFEHLMFEGSSNIPDFDGPLQRAGGESNAFTSSDITNYYDVLPANNLDTALWLESDRMLSLNFSEEALAVQKKVVSEEFKQRNLNQPYGDVWHHLMALTYENHPYKWPVIGKNLDHIEAFELQDVKDFFFKHYRPQHAIMCISGGVNADEVFEKVNKWFGAIPKGETYSRNVPQENMQSAYRIKKVESDVPMDAIYMTFKMPGRRDDAFYAADMISDILSAGSSSRFNQKLVKESKLFVEAHAYITSNIDPGILVMEGKLHNGVSFEEAENAIWKIVEELRTDGIADRELQKVKNKIESHIRFSQSGILNRAMDLCYFELLGDIELINTEADKYGSVSADEIIEALNKYVQKDKASVLHYKSNQ